MNVTIKNNFDRLSLIRFRMKLIAYSLELDYNIIEFLKDINYIMRLKK